MSQLCSLGDRQWLRGAVFCLICGLTVAIFTWFADPNSALEKLSGGPEGGNYNLLARAFSAGQLSVKRETPSELAKLADPYDPNANASYITGVNDLIITKANYISIGASTLVPTFSGPYHELIGHFLSESGSGFFFGLGFGADRDRLSARYSAALFSRNQPVGGRGQRYCAGPGIGR